MPQRAHGTITTTFVAPSSISSDPFVLIITITGASAGINYLKTDLYKNGSTNYFGETHNNSEWYNGSDGTKYFPITIESGTVWQGQLQVKLGSPTLNEYDGQGQYKIRVRRYTQSGNYTSSEANANTTDITIDVPLSTPTPIITPTTTPSLTETTQPTVTPTPPTSISYSNIFISEVMPYPEDTTEEWLELYNNNDFDVSLDNWYIDDGENTGSSPKLFTITIPSKQYIVIELTSSLFNNDGDTVRILDFNKTEKDAFSYSTSQKGKTYGRTSFSSRDVCQQNPTKKANNSGCIVNEPEKTPPPSPSQTPPPLSTQVITPSQPPEATREFSLLQKPIIIDDKPIDIEETINSDTESLPSQGSVLSAETHYNNTQKRKKSEAYVLGLSSSSALISLLNIGTIVRKIIQRMSP